MFSVAPDASSPLALAAPISASDQATLPSPSKALPVPPTVRVRAVASLVADTAVAPAYKAPTFAAVRVMLAVPSKSTPAIVRAVASLVAATAVSPAYKAPTSAAVGLLTGE